MSSRLCPFCMRMSESDICPHCGKSIQYAGSPTHLPAGYVVSGAHPYVIGAALGQGGFGITYIALDMVSGERVAIKEYFPTFCASRTSGTVSAYPNQEETFRKGRERFLDEARVLKSLSDLKSIVNVLDFFEFNNSAYLVMEFLDGLSLKEYAAKNGKFPAQKFLRQIRPLMEDLERMHQRGVVHRDIAPDNIILLPDGQMKLIDFGAARSFVGDRSMTVVVKKGFAPVEQYLTKGSTASTDVYALAATIYYCITDTVPMDSAERQYENVPLQSPSALGADITSLQETALGKALEIQQKTRTQSVQEFLDNLNAKDTVTKKHKPPVPVPQPVKPKPSPRKKKKFPAVLAAAAAALVLLGGFFLFSGKDSGISALVSSPFVNTWKKNVLHYEHAFSSGALSSTPVYGSNIPRSRIVSITFLDTLENVPDTSWDMSSTQNGSVLAWVAKNGENYDLYMAREGGINAGTSAQGLFRCFTSLTAIHNLQYLHTENVTDMSSMFQNCYALSAISLADLDLSKVEDMSNMFSDCSSLTSCDFSQTDLSNVTGLDHMFYDCTSLTAVNFAGLDLSNVISMERMFRNCSSLISCDFSKTDISTVTDPEKMFSGCSSLTAVKYGNSQTYRPDEFVRMISAQ